MQNSTTLHLFATSSYSLKRISNDHLVEIRIHNSFKEIFPIVVDLVVKYLLSYHSSDKLTPNYQI